MPSSRRKALIIGYQGQDGSYLDDSLRSDGWAVSGLGSRHLRMADGTVGGAVALHDRPAVARMIEAVAPDVVYYLAAHHHSSQDRAVKDDSTALLSVDVNLSGLVNVLHCLVNRPRCRLLYASSSHVFGAAIQSPQSETTPLDPATPYAVTKAAGMRFCRIYREEWGVFASSAILYNHESPRRPPNFLSRRLAHAVARIAFGSDETITVGSLDAGADWGYATDYIAAMRAVVDLPAPGDFVVATGEFHTVRDFISEAFSAVGISDWQSRVVENGSLLARASLNLVGNAAKLRAATGWRPSVSFAELVRLLVQAEIDHLRGNADAGANADNDPDL